ncbi:dihydropteroate synthase [Sphingomonas naphthae]|uniref:dihydropteroate synthase n=1 Tax=Sphingomonas naphthae TaxID=1813468 RepID=A0ABY7TI74_9SPHN|nr:dihydropteroate synthase [Sphingomonas naphthae]WCT72029.1 dihydropteroate synthase [Sphingomonas naphthae]
MTLYLRPTAFVDAPFGLDGQVLRLAGGLCWFSAIEAIAAADGRRTGTTLVPVERLSSFLATLDITARAGAEATIARLTAPRPALMLGERRIGLDEPKVMAILNVTPDSFSDGGTHADPVADGVAMAAAGAALVDVGGESTRPGAEAVWEGEEIARVARVVAGLARAGVALSIDTRKAGVMEAVLAAAPAIVNDVSALLWDPRSAEVVARAGASVVLMHHQGSPETMQRGPAYGDVLLEVYDWLGERIAAAVAAGIDRARIVVDPGIGFGKTVAHNLALLNGLSLFHGLGCPILLGASRKRFLGALDGEAPADRRLGGSLATVMAGAGQGVQLFRVHDVAETVQALRVWRGMRDQALTFQAPTPM